MRRDRCPHCKEYGFLVGKLPKEVVAVLACHHCEELSVLFRGKIIPLDKRILESGTFEERKMHLADVIAQFLESGDLDFTPEAGRESRRRRPAQREEESKEAPDAPISDQELDRFIQIDLKCLDNPTYFKRIFG